MTFDTSYQLHREPAACRIRIADDEIAHLYPYLIEVEVETSRTEAAIARLKFESRRLEAGKWAVQDDTSIAAWHSILIEAQFGQAAQEVFRGYIREIRSEYPIEAGASTVIVTCQDESIRMDRQHNREAWGAESPTTDSAIVQTLLERVDLTLHPDSVPGQEGLALNQDGTDIQFLRERADANGYELIFRQGQVYFGPYRLKGEPQPTIMVYAGASTNCLHVSLDHRADQPDVVAFDLAPNEGTKPLKQRVEPNLHLLGRIPARSDSEGLGEHVWRMVRQGGADEPTLRAKAQRKANELSLKVIAEGELDGSLYGHVLLAGGVVGLDGVGERYGGRYYVDVVNHHFTADGYREKFTLIRNGLGDDSTAERSVLGRVF